MAYVRLIGWLVGWLVSWLVGWMVFNVNYSCISDIS